MGKEDEAMPFMTKGLRGGVLVAATIAILADTAAAQDVYPSRGQSPQQQQQDQGQCQTWAMQQVGPPQAAPPTSEGQVVRGAGRGAAVGAIGGAIGGNAGKGAAIGAATGA